jgi:hypothetical protein
MARTAVSIAAMLVGFGATAAEPEGTLVCAAKGGGFDCEKGKCNPAKVTMGGDIRLDFAAKTLCSLRGAECPRALAVQHAFLEEPTKTIVAAVTADGATMLFRIDAELRMAMVFVIGTGRVLSFTGDCRKP